MLRPVERSITVSAPQRIAHTIFSTSSSTEEVTAELPILALILARKLRPMIIGSSSAWLMLDGMMARPRAISSRTNSGVTNGRHRRRRSSRRRRAPPRRARACCLAAEVLALGDVDHLLGDDAGLRAHSNWVTGLAVERAHRLRRVGEVARQVLAGDVAVVDRLDRAAVVFLDAAALLHPFDARALQPLLDVDRRRRRRCRGRWCRRPAAAARPTDGSSTISRSGTRRSGAASGAE